VSPPADTKPLPAVVKHLGHDWETVEASSLVECAKDFGLVSNLDPIANAQIQASLR
jgi:hypothetical protein